MQGFKPTEINSLTKIYPTIPVPGENISSAQEQAAPPMRGQIKKICGTCWGYEGTSNERKELWFKGALGASVACIVAGNGCALAGVTMKIGMCGTEVLGDYLCLTGTFTSLVSTPSALVMLNQKQ